MHDVNPEAWKDFYVAIAGAAATLAGLVFVALSINLSRVLAIPGMSARGAEALFLLSAALLTALIALIPGQSPSSLGLELGVVALAAWGLPVTLHVQAGRARYYQKRWHFLERILLHQAATIPLILASVLLLGGMGYARYWLAAGVLVALVAALLNAWVLLVEIMR